MNRYPICCRLLLDSFRRSNSRLNRTIALWSGCRRIGAVALLSCLTIGLTVGLLPLPISGQEPDSQETNNETEEPEPSDVQSGQSSSAANSSNGRPILKLGSQGEAVAELQAILKLLGYYTGTVDGTYQESTATAVSTFQQAAGLQPDGIVGTETWNRLLPAAPAVSASTSPSTSASTSTSTATAPLTPSPAASITSPTPSPAPTPATPAPANFPAPSPVPTSAPMAPSSPAPSPLSSPAPASSEALRSAAPTAPAPAAPTPTPTPAPASTAALSAQPILRVGMEGAAVTQLQERLKAIGVFDGAVDGVFGAETEVAVQEAQRRYNLEPDGVVGPATWEALLRN